MGLTAPRRGRPPRSNEELAAHRANLVRGAMDAIRRCGPDLSIDEIAAGAGVSKPVIYDQFGGRVGVADAIALVLADRLESSAWQRLDPAPIDAESVIDAIVHALMDLIEDEPELYSFIVTAMRGDRRGLLDNALVEALHERTGPVLAAITPTIGADELSVLTDGVYGFVLATLESWQSSRHPDRDAMVAMISSVIRAGLRAVAEQPPPKVP